MGTETAFREALETWGPASSRRAVSLEEAHAYCRRLALSHYENFPITNFLLPRSLHQHFFNVYAYCRWSDDLGDEVGDSANSLQLLDWWRDELRQCFAGETSHPVFIALAGTVREFSIPIAPFEDLISAFEQDQTIVQYETFSDLLDYCRRSANPVGRLVLYLLREASESNFTWSDSICTGLQLANFWQDVRRDLEIGRVYLPLEDLRRFECSIEELQNRVTNSRFVELMEFEVHRTRRFLWPWEPGRPPGFASFPFRLQVELELFARGGLKILDRIARIGYRVLDTRPVVTKLDFAKLLASALLASVSRKFGRQWRTSRASAE